MTKAEVVQAISEKARLDRKSVLLTIEALMSTVKTSMCEGKNIYLRGFGTFHLKKRARKPARVITRGEQIIIPAHHIAAFKAAKSFKKRLAKSVPVK